MCWFCHWGWPKPIADIYQKAVKDLDGYSSPMHFGPAHIVWDDCNFDSAQWCIDNFDDYRGDLTPEQCELVMRSLLELLEVPDYLKDVPDGCDGIEPSECPPWPDVVMVKQH